MIFDKQSLMTVVLPYYNYSNDCCHLMRSLCKTTKDIYEDNKDNFHRIFSKRDLKLHYPLFERLAPALEKNSRFAQYRLDLQVKFPEDFPKLDKFIQDHPKTEFKHLHLVITEDSLEAANKVIDTMRDVGMINKEVDESYSFLDSSNYCRAANMSTKLRYETEMIIGAEPKAFIDKVEEVGHLDVRQIARCPVEDIDIPVYSIKADAEFCTSLESEEREVKDTFKESVKKATIEDEIKKVGLTLDQHIGNLQKYYKGATNIELMTNGPELSAEEITALFTNQYVRRVEHEGFEQGDEEIAPLLIEGKKMFFALSDGATTHLIRADEFSVEFSEDAHTKQGDFVVIDPKKINITASNLVRDEECKYYAEISSLSLTQTSLIIHDRFVDRLNIKDVPSSEISIWPTQSLTVYVDEREQYDALNKYITNLSASIPITLELDMAFVENAEASKGVVDNIFSKNLVRLHIVMEMHDQDFIDHLYGLAKQSETLLEIMPIIHQDTTKVVDLIKDCPKIQQWIMDVRLPLEEQRESIKELFMNDKNNKFVLRDVHEFLIEFRFPTSFEIQPIV